MDQKGQLLIFFLTKMSMRSKVKAQPYILIIRKNGLPVTASGRVGFSEGRVSSLGLGLENFPYKRQIFSLRVKKNLLKSGQRQVGSAIFGLGLSLENYP